MLRAVKQEKHHGRHYNYRVYEGGKNLGLYAANTPTTLVAIPHPSGAEIERPYMLPIDGDVNFVMGPPVVVTAEMVNDIMGLGTVVEEHAAECWPCRGPCKWGRPRI